MISYTDEYVLRFQNKGCISSTQNADRAVNRD